MLSKFSKILRLEFSTELIVPVVLVAIYITFLIILRGTIPSSQELIEHLASLYERFGYEVIFIGAALEALVVINFFVPGSAAVAFGAIFARSGQVDLTWAVLSAAFGAMFGFMIDFIIGYFGFGTLLKKSGYGSFIEKAKNQIVKNSLKTFILGFIHPNIGSFISLAGGTLKMNFVTFFILSGLSTLAWVSFWGILVFALGEVFLIILTKYIWVVVLLVLSVWILSTVYSRQSSAVSRQTNPRKSDS